MQLPSPQRRNIIEELLDIQVFSRMNQLLKEKIARFKELINDSNNQLEIISEKVRLQIKYITDVESLAKDQVRDKQAEVIQHQESIKTLQEVNSGLSIKLQSLIDKQKSLRAIETKKNKLNQLGSKIETNLQSLESNRAFFVDNTSCPTCSQEINSETREKHVHTCDTKIGEIQQGIEKLQEEILGIETMESTLLEEIESFQSAQLDIVANNASITQLQKTIDKLETEILKIEG